MARLTTETMPFPSYIVISPVKDEDQFIALTLESVVRQTQRPARWIIVDDGSADRTPSMVNRYLRENSFIRLIQSRQGGARLTGTTEIRAFQRGFELLEGQPYDFIVKLDGDLSFVPDYFERLLGEFQNDSKLGIASGVYEEQEDDGAWHEVRMPPYHAAGASKVIRRACFEAIGGFVNTPGWDTVDEIRAMTRGWKTRHFRHLRIKHLRREGSAAGLHQTNRMLGEIYYLTGGSKLFFILKVLGRMLRRPFVSGGLAMLRGYLNCWRQRRPLLVSVEEQACYRALLRGRLTGRLQRLCGLDSPR
jgi:biofilm PGA synthesis N-glycosyltransferase PgaC